MNTFTLAFGLALMSLAVEAQAAVFPYEIACASNWLENDEYITLQLRKNADGNDEFVLDRLNRSGVRLSPERTFLIKTVHQDPKLIKADSSESNVKFAGGGAIDGTLRLPPPLNPSPHPVPLPSVSWEETFTLWDGTLGKFVVQSQTTIDLRCHVWTK